MRTLVHSKASVAWLILTALTALSWALGTERAFGDDHTPASLIVIVVAVFKVRLVGLFFMELKAAPLALRALFEGYCAVLLALLMGLYLLA